MCLDLGDCQRGCAERETERGEGVGEEAMEGWQLKPCLLMANDAAGKRAEKNYKIY